MIGASPHPVPSSVGSGSLTQAKGAALVEGTASAERAAWPEKAAIAVGAVIWALLLIDLVTTLPGGFEDVIDRIALYSSFVAVGATTVLFVVCLFALAFPLVLVLLAGRACVLCGQSAARARMGLRVTSVLAFVYFAALLALAVLVFDSPSLSSTDFMGPMYFVFGLMGGWVKGQIPLFVAAGAVSVAAGVLHRTSPGAV